jgi:hypothetical protein
MLKKNQAKLIGMLFFALISVFLLFGKQTLQTVQAMASGPPARATGAPNEQTCTQCHSGTANTGVGQFTITGLPARYTPGLTYQLTVQHSTTDSTRKRWGFQLTVLNSSNEIAGQLFSNSSLTQTVSEQGRQYIEHNTTGTQAGQTGGAIWTFNWTAPAGDVGPVTFYAAGNQANNNSSDSGDQIYITNATVDPPLVVLGTPVIQSVVISGKKLIVTGENFEDGATLFMDNAKVKKTTNDTANPAGSLIARKGGNLIVSGQAVVLQVRNPSGTVSDNFNFTRP